MMRFFFLVIFCLTTAVNICLCQIELFPHFSYDFSVDSEQGQIELATILKENFHFLDPENLIGVEDEAFADEQISPLCKAHRQDFWRTLLSGDAIWPLQMIDAWGKLPSGMLNGHVNSIGDFDQCLAIRGQSINTTDNSTTVFKGRHCNVHFLLPSSGESNARTSVLNTDDIIDEPFLGDGVILAMQLTAPTLGTCYPSSCSRKDVQIIFSRLAGLTNGLLNPLVSSCYVDEKPDFDAGVIVMLCLLSVIIALAVVGTVVDIALRQLDNNFEKKFNPDSKSVPVKIFLAFSVYTNTQKWMNTKAGGDNLGCLHGLRFLSMCWVVIAHTWTVLMYHYNWNTAKLFQIFDEWSMLMILNATFSVDTFFTMGGLLVAYQLLRTLDKTKGKFNPLLMYLHRYLRLTPTYAILIGIAATLQPYLSTGPSWTIIDVRSGYCRKNWWHNLLYINNLMSVNVTENIQDNYCLGGAWYLGNDFQFFILSPFLIFPLWKWPKIGMGLLGLLSAGSMAVVGVITDVNDLPPSSIPFRQENADEYQKQVYTKPWTRIGPYLVGIWTGFILYKMKQRRSRIPKMVVLLGWILSTTCALGLIFGPKDWFNPTNKIGRWEGVFYASFHRHLWAISIGWIILACVMGSGGIVNKILSWKPFMPLGRLSFCTYLASLEIQMMYSSRVKQSLIYDPFTQTNIFFSHLTLSLFVGFVLTILLESPFMQLEKLAFGRLGEEKRKDNVAVEAHNPEFSLPRAQVPSGTSTYSNFNNNKA